MAKMDSELQLENVWSWQIFFKVFYLVIDEN